MELFWLIYIFYFSFIRSFFLVLKTIISGVDLPGYASTIVAILFLGGIQLITLGVIGEYIARIYEEVKQRPLYLIRETYGIEDDLSSGFGVRSSELK